MALTQLTGIEGGQRWRNIPTVQRGTTAAHSMLFLRQTPAHTRHQHASVPLVLGLRGSAPIRPPDPEMVVARRGLWLPQKDGSSHGPEKSEALA